MQARTPYYLPDKQSSPSRHSPKPHSEREEELPTETQYRLERVFEEARVREEKYISMIKQLQAKRKEEAQHYLSTLTQLKKEFVDYMELKQPKKQPKWKVPFIHPQTEQKQYDNKPNSHEFTTNTKLNLQSQLKEDDTKSIQPILKCKANFYYYTPHFKDYIRQTLPEQLILNIRTIYPRQEYSLPLTVIKEEEEIDQLNALIEKIPLEIATPEQTSLIVQFDIPCQASAIQHYKLKQFQLQLINKEGMFVYAYGQLNLSSLLYYENRPTQWIAKPVDFYCPIDGSKLGTMSLKLGNQLQLTDKEQRYKIQSNTPMQLATLKSGIDYNDDQSRMIQRISKFKSAHNSLLLGIGPTREANAQQYFQTENNKLVVMHRKKKQLQSIQQYKQNHKQQLMDKLFDHAISKYYLAECELGNPKYVVYYYFNQQKEHKRIYFKHSLAPENKNKTENNVNAQNLHQHITVTVVHPKQFKTLRQKQLVQIPEQSHYQYTMQEEEQSMWALSGMSHPIVLKILCYPPKQSVITPDTLSSTFELKLTLTDDYDSEIDIFRTKLKIYEPNIQHKLYLHGYSQNQSELEIPFDQTENTIIPKSVMTNKQDLVYNWDHHYTRLSLKLRHGSPGQKLFYLIINDHDLLFQISCYQIVLTTYPKLNREIKLIPGQVEKLTLDFSFDQTSLPKINQELSPKGKKNKIKDQIRVLFASSKPEHCNVRCENESELLCRLNKVYQVEAKIQTFSQQPNPEQIIIHAVNLDTNEIIKRWLIQIHKEKAQYQKVYKLQVDHKKTLKYKFQLSNTQHTSKIYRLYSSNQAVLTLPMNSVSLVSNQEMTLNLEFTVKQALSNQELAEPMKIILTVTDGMTFLNYLFQLTVRVR